MNLRISEYVFKCLPYVLRIEAQQGYLRSEDATEQDWSGEHELEGTEATVFHAWTMDIHVQTLLLCSPVQICMFSIYFNSVCWQHPSRPSENMLPHISWI